ncbi:hypothetical protein [Pseudomonas sp. TTU2014-080ASC]|uniref:hypothetical protein n=1 Tax=Pseudomonas sp. TTU2014-080ASC TaxID=1729724 RepID=UPI000718A377|nr:hypothetical protein [Pseudomonas sp. TTU2014-080ASC]KRW61866.1 hypothetical protein AO726_00035 [Pseudomonas sp. TTU2014-080ASC]
MTLEGLTSASLGEIKTVFNELEPVPAGARQGFFRASFVGPWWLRASAGPGLVLGGLPGWQGKRFIDANTATNVLQRRHGVEEKLRMSCQESVSAVDGRMGVALIYGADAPLPWRWIRDELRMLDDNTWLAMTVVDVPILRGLALPFVLQREA